MSETGAGGIDIAGLGERRACFEEKPRNLPLVEGHLFCVHARPVSAGGVAEKPAVARIGEMRRDGVERIAHDALDGGLARGPPSPQQQGERLRLGELGSHAKAPMLGVGAAEEASHDLFDEVPRRGLRWRRALTWSPARPPVLESPVDKALEARVPRSTCPLG